VVQAAAVTHELLDGGDLGLRISAGHLESPSLHTVDTSTRYGGPGGRAGRGAPPSGAPAVGSRGGSLSTVPQLAQGLAQVARRQDALVALRAGALHGLPVAGDLARKSVV